MEAFELGARFGEHGRPLARNGATRCYPVEVSRWTLALVPALLASAVFVTVAVAADAAPASPGKVTGTVVVSSSEPQVPECAPDAGKPNATIWDKAKTPARDEHCQTLKKAFAKIRAGSYREAIELADLAEQLSPGQSGPWVVRGSANARWGKDTIAVAAFEKARTIHPRALDHARSLDDYAAALVRRGRLDDARKTYRALLPRAAGLCDTVSVCPDVGVAFLSAGVLAMHVGPEGLPEAVAILREARGKSDPKSEVHRVASLALALALDRNGDLEQARSVAEELVKARGVPSEVASELVARLPAAYEVSAMRAIGYEVADPPAAVAAWKAFLDGGGDKGPWAAHAKQHAAKVSGKPGKKP